MNNIHSHYDITWVGLLEIRNRKILTTREIGSGLFQLPGGGQNIGEDHETTLKREVREELNVEIENAKLYDDFVLPGRHENALIRFLIYRGDITGQIKPGNEIEEIKWIDSRYEKCYLDIGNAAKLQLIPRLIKEDLID